LDIEIIYAVVHHEVSESPTLMPVSILAVLHEALFIELFCDLDLK